MLFVDKRTLTIVERNTEISAEVIEGLLVRVNDVDLCLLLELDGDYVQFIKEGYVDVLWEYNKPNDNQRLVLKKDLEEFCKLNKVTAPQLPVPEILKVKKEKPVITNIKLPTKSTFDKDVKAMIQSFAEEFKLTRDGEHSIYKFKSPNLR